MASIPVASGAPGTARPRRRAAGLHDVLATPWGWALLVAVVAAFLAYGSIHPAAQTRQARIGYLESVLKCPSCDGISIAQSNGPQAAALRASVSRWVGEGWSDGRVEQAVVARYGPAELLRPTSPVVWVVPLVAVGTAVAALAVVLARRRGGGGAATMAAEEDEALVASALGRDGGPG